MSVRVPVRVCNKLVGVTILHVVTGLKRWAGHVARMGEERGVQGLGGETGGKETTGEI